MKERTEDDRLAQRQYTAHHVADQRRRGLVRISVWVPEEDAERIKNIGAQLRRDAGKPLPGDDHARPRAVEVPIVSHQRFPEHKRVWFQSAPDELGVHMLLRANGGVWRGSRELWDVPAYLPARLGLQGRVVGRRDED